MTEGLGDGAANPVQWTLRGLITSQLGNVLTPEVALTTGGYQTPKYFIFDQVRGSCLLKPVRSAWLPELLAVDTLSCWLVLICPGLCSERVLLCCSLATRAAGWRMTSLCSWHSVL